MGTCHVLRKRTTRIPSWLLLPNHFDCVSTVNTTDFCHIPVTSSVEELDLMHTTELRSRCLLGQFVIPRVSSIGLILWSQPHCCDPFARPRHFSGTGKGHVKKWLADYEHASKTNLWNPTFMVANLSYYWGEWPVCGFTGMKHVHKQKMKDLFEKPVIWARNQRKTTRKQQRRTTTQALDLQLKVYWSFSLVSSFYYYEPTHPES